MAYTGRFGQSDDFRREELIRVLVDYFGSYALVEITLLLLLILPALAVCRLTKE